VVLGQDPYHDGRSGRTFVGGEPEPPLMVAVASVALVANSLCLWLV
jgi:hypothetical protein